MEWAEKIKCIENELGISEDRGRLARLIGVRPGIISDIKTGKSKKPSADIPLLLITTLGVNPEWLENEKQPIFVDLNWLIRQPWGQDLPIAKQKKQLIDINAGYEKAEKTALYKDPPGIPLVYEGAEGLEDGIVIPMLENAASAGYGNGLDDNDTPVRYIQVPHHLSKYPHLAGLPVKGDSMEPTLHDGDLVVCDGDGWDGDGIYVLKTHDTSYVKRVQMTSQGYEVISDNKMYKSITESAESLSIVGKVRAILVIVPGRRGGV